ncbi:MAG TPA: hypothetical protein DEP60_06880 [Ruminococcaceae bacterium]|jgi:hypothetical protein|nr:hypothetical protein [Oscillospiraceae bacterium]
MKEKILSRNEYCDLLDSVYELRKEVSRQHRVMQKTLFLIEDMLLSNRIQLSEIARSVRLEIGNIAYINAIRVARDYYHSREKYQSVLDIWKEDIDSLTTSSQKEELSERWNDYRQSLNSTFQKGQQK